MDSPEHLAAVTGGSTVKSGGILPGELELATRLILGDRELAVLPGPWWAYLPEERLITYPEALTRTWSDERLVGGMCHQVAEAFYTGRRGRNRIEYWLRQQRRHGYPADSMRLLALTVNDLRVNRLYLQRRPGAGPYFSELYRVLPDLEPRSDVGAPPDSSGFLRPPHHLFLDALTTRAVNRRWPGNCETPFTPEMIQDALDQTDRDVERAIESDDVESMLRRLTGKTARTYAGLIGEWQAMSQQTDRPAGEEGGQPNAPAGEQDATAARANAETAEGEIGEEALQLRSGSGSSEAVQRARQRLQQRKIASLRVRGARRLLDRERNSHQSPRWAAELVEAIRRGEADERVDYENFDYLAAVNRLEKGIKATVEGDGRHPGLAQIMDRRRQGESEAHRRPRKRRSGETGNIDLQRPERVLTDPLNAFLKGLRVPRQDRQRDFASSILLDISGSMVQKGYPTRKFDRLADSAILFIEIHERLRIPFEVIAFSSQVTPLWTFEECVWPRQLSGRAAPYEPRDHAEIFKRLYDLDHKDTDDAGALAVALERSREQKGLKSVFVVTDGISSDPALLRRALIDMHRRNQAALPDQRYKVLAFGVGVVKSEFQLAYQPTHDGKPLASCAGAVVENVASLPEIIRSAVDERIRYL
ncbi:MAG: VWA domain-containing protein [Chloroflexi bacterium]|nr:VWA domain-containing protein [Chloroflexota bacterium]MYC48564.1 VWA domain-containing protein [Chloroflexota bacterium]